MLIEEIADRIRAIHETRVDDSSGIDFLIVEYNLLLLSGGEVSASSGLAPGH